MIIKEPRNEFELVILFAQYCVSISDVEIVSFSGSFPDAVVSWNGEIYRVEFEYVSSNFLAHDHNPAGCDLIICWEDNNPYSVLPVVALNESDWFERGVRIVSDLEKTVHYWKRRAIIAENELSDLNNPSGQEKRILIMLNNGDSYRTITQSIWGGIGSHYNNKIRSVAIKHNLQYP